MNLNDYISKHALEHPETPALCFENEELTYADLEERIDRLATCLREIGLQEDEKVGVLMPNCPENVISFLAILKLGCIEVNFNPQTDIGFVVDSFRTSDISLLIHYKLDEAVEQKAVDALQTDGVRLLNFKDIVESGPGFDKKDSVSQKIEFKKTDPEKLSLIQFTSGSSGEAKGVMLNQQSFINASFRRYQTIGLDTSSVHLICINLSHSCAKSILFDALVSGATIVLMERFMPLYKFMRTLLSRKVTILTGPPYMFNYLLKLNDANTIAKIQKHTAYFEIGLSVVAKELIKRLRAKFPKVTLINRYGVTEFAGAASSTIHRAGAPLVNAGSAGDLSGKTNISLVPLSDEQGKYEICVSGNSIMMGYLGDDATTAATYQTKGFMTGDLATLDAEKNVYVLDRKDDTIKILGEKVVPSEIEAEVLKLRQIYEVAVFGVSEHSTREKIVLLYNTNEPLAERELKEHCLTSLPHNVAPDEYIRLRSGIPKNAMGKVSKTYLKNIYLNNEINTLT